MRIPEVRNEGEDLRRDLVDRCEYILPNANQAEDLESVLLENIDLENFAHQLKSTSISLAHLTSVAPRVPAILQTWASVLRRDIF